MNIYFSRAFLGKEIIRAWRQLASARPGDFRKYSVSQSPKRYVQDEGPSSRRTGQTRFKSVDLSIRPYIRKKRFIFFGAETWETENDLAINIHDLELETKYNSLTLFVHFGLSDGRLREFDDNSSPKNIRGQVAQIVKAFLSALDKTQKEG